jgi:hypothetical protein
MIKKILFIIVTGLMSSCGFLFANKPISNEPHQGNHIKVWIDGERSQALTEPVFNGVNFFKYISGPGLWFVDDSVSGKPQFEYSFDDTVLGKFVEAKATIERHTPESYLGWETIYTNLSIPSADFAPGYTIPSSHFQLGEDDKMLESLPSGTYLVRLFVYGEKDWDSQVIFMMVS